jgi:hypothetical protein
MYELIKIKIGPESKDEVTQVVETEAKQEIQTTRRREQRQDPEKFMPYAILLIDAGQIYQNKDFKVPLNELKVSPQLKKRVKTAFEYMAGQGGEAKTDALIQIAYMLVEEGLKAL